jgi:nitroimidazol reductase NimA-like FMN-containing flavoprotein (pyridoxamine 5'-phosphate oxidase superfamily)
MTIDAVRPVQTWTIDLAEEDCRRLLSTAAVGRLGVIVKGRPEIFPIAHAHDSATGCVVFPTRPGTKMEAAFDWPWVAFEVDGLDDDGTEAWSVAIVGHAEEVTRCRRDRSGAGHAPRAVGGGCEGPLDPDRAVQDDRTPDQGSALKGSSTGPSQRVIRRGRARQLAALRRSLATARS